MFLQNIQKSLSMEQLILYWYMENHKKIFNYFEKMLIYFYLFLKHLKTNIVQLQYFLIDTQNKSS